MHKCAFLKEEEEEEEHKKLLIWDVKHRHPGRSPAEPVSQQAAAPGEGRM